MNRYYWSLRREIWEFPSLYIVPMIAGGIAVLTFAVNALFGSRPLAVAPHILAAGLVMGGAYIVAIFYSLDSLYGERRDRSILFWKSLPVSDTTTVLAKLTVPLIITPLISFVVSMVTLIASTPFVHLQVPLLRTAWLVLYHMFTVHSLWWSPLFGWLFLISVLSKRTPFVWALLPVFLIRVVERMALGTSRFTDMITRHLTMSPDALLAQGTMPIDPGTHLTPVAFVTDPSLWLGFLVTALMIAVAIRLRRSRGPI